MQMMNIIQKYFELKTDYISKLIVNDEVLIMHLIILYLILLKTKTNLKIIIVKASPLLYYHFKINLHL